MPSRRLVLLFVTLCFSIALSAQQEAKETEPSEHHESAHTSAEGHEEAAHSSGEAHEFKHHFIGLSIGHTHVATGVAEGSSRWLVLPSFGLSYVYGFNEKWGIGLHNEIIVEDFLVKDSRGRSSGGGGDIAVIERGRPIAVALVGIYKIHPNIGIVAGGGMEFSSHENFGLVKLGLEFPYHLRHGWEIFGTLSADLKIDAYNSFSFGFGIAKLL